MTVAHPTLRNALVRVLTLKRIGRTRFQLALFGTLVTAINAVLDAIANRRQLDAPISVTAKRIRTVLVHVARTIRVVRLVAVVATIVIAVAHVRIVDALLRAFALKLTCKRLAK